MFEERDETIRRIHDLQISKVDLSVLADVLPSQINAYVNRRRLSFEKCRRIEQAAAEISFVYGPREPGYPAQPSKYSFRQKLAAMTSEQVKQRCAEDPAFEHALNDLEK